MVQIDQIIAVGSKVGLFKLVASRSNGLILEDLLTHKTNFYSSRSFQFSPLESIGIYTLSDNIPLKDVYTRFLEKENELTPPDENASNEDYKTYFETILPEYDRYRVHLKDMQKCLKWYYQLKALGFIKTDEPLIDSSIEPSVA
ncbi:MAG: DUF5606 domain-containing protein [Saprospiraceae bacterium]|nr:DUF5606 domain-containing protein [Saprospiraceae bacterium]MBK8297282.1 DUF5606 domain-containing protein [Saprospiraceae bacterium]